MDETGQYVLNAQSEQAGFTRTAISKWAKVGYLSAVDYNGEIFVRSALISLTVVVRPVLVPTTSDGL